MERVSRLTSTKKNDWESNIISAVMSIGSNFNMSYQEVIDMPIPAFNEYCDVLIKQQEEAKKKKTVSKHKKVI